MGILKNRPQNSFPIWENGGKTMTKMGISPFRVIAPLGALESFGTAKLATWETMMLSDSTYPVYCKPKIKRLINY